MKREYPDRPIVAVGAAVCRDGRVLVVRRGREPSLGKWTVPGGVVDLGETMHDAAAREVREECGIEVEVGPVVGTLDNILRDERGAIRYHYAIIDFGARYVSGELSINDELMDTLRVFAHEAAIVLDNSLLYRQLGRTNRELQRTIDELTASRARERALRQEVRALKIEIDETKREKQVAEITETDYFQQLADRARQLRKRDK